MSTSQIAGKQVGTTAGKAQRTDKEILAAKKKAKMKKIAVRWGGHAVITGDGFVPVPRRFLRYASKLPFPLSPAEQLFVLNLMFHKWDSAKPFPSYATLATRMGVSLQYARDIGRKLSAKGYLVREIRRGRSNRFDLAPLFSALAHVIDVEIAEKKIKAEAAS
jgi:hypothetical protein